MDNEPFLKTLYLLGTLSFLICQHVVGASTNPTVNCKVPDCNEICLYGYVRDSNDCLTCTCVYPCQSVRCPNGTFCEVTRDNDAQQYQGRCNECLPVLCKMLCPYGWEEDSNGCDICKCKDPCRGVRCRHGKSCVILKARHNFIGRCERRRKRSEDTPPIILPPLSCEDRKCNNTCEYGYTKDGLGCPSCNCYDPCKIVNCPIGSACHPQYLNLTISYIGKCFNPDGTIRCLEESCDLKCQYGYPRDDNGCKVCKCVDPCSQMNCSLKSRCEVIQNQDRLYVGQCVQDKNCSDVQCKMSCPFGFATDNNSCAICSCHDPCQDILCTAGACIPLQVDNSTYIGICQTETSPRCPIVCTNITCEYGHALDNAGCEKCECANPCANFTCNSTYLYCTPRRVVNSRIFVGDCHSSKECPPANCELICDYGQARDNEGCLMCSCANPCQGVHCDRNSMCYSEKLENLTYIGICKPELPRTSECMNKTCDFNCQYGYEKDNYSCNTCTCTYPCKDVVCEDGLRCLVQKDESSGGYTVLCLPECMNETCNLNCTYGLAKDINGCKVCGCLDPCAELKCPSEYKCSPKRETDEFIGECIHDCRRVENCNEECDYGFAKDNFGCRMCACQNPCGDMKCKAGEECDIIKLNDTDYIGKCVPITTTECMNITCSKKCNYGLQKDKYNCPICECNDPCKDKLCRADEVCQPQGGTHNNEFVGACIAKKPCPQIQCSNGCSYGMKKSADGCDTCDCLPDPCFNITCGDRMKCIVQQRNNSFNANCIVAENPCLDKMCESQCTYDIKFVRGLDCSSCHCQDPCLDAKCHGNMCIITKKDYQVKNVTYRISHPICSDEKCPPVNCTQICSEGFKMDEVGCPTCHCNDACHTANCSASQYCELTQVYKENSLGTYTMETTGACHDCLLSSCLNPCLFGRDGCKGCECAGNPCLSATPYPNKMCMPIISDGFYQLQDYVYISGKNCTELQKIYSDLLLQGNLNCDSSHNFKPIQCTVPGGCWCTDPDGNLLPGSKEFKSIQDIQCGGYLKEFGKLHLLMEMKFLPFEEYDQFKLDISKQLAKKLSIPEDQVIILSLMGAPDGMIDAEFLILSSSKDGSNSLRNILRDLSKKKLDFNYVVDPISGTLIPYFMTTTNTTTTTAATTTAAAAVPPPRSTSYPSFTLLTRQDQSSITPSVQPSREPSYPYGQVTQNDWKHKETVKFYLLSILLPLLLALFAMVIILLIGLCFIKFIKGSRDGTRTNSLTKTPFVDSFDAGEKQPSVYTVSGTTIVSHA